MEGNIVDKILLLKRSYIFNFPRLRITKDHFRRFKENKTRVKDKIELNDALPKNRRGKKTNIH